MQRTSESSVVLQTRDDGTQISKKWGYGKSTMQASYPQGPYVKDFRPLHIFTLEVRSSAFNPFPLSYLRDLQSTPQMRSQASKEKDVRV
jgi:hypothetical protein